MLTPLLIWSDKLAIKNQPSLDEQHQQLFKRVNTLCHLFRENHNRVEIIRLLSQLQAETRAHFEYEEQWFHLLAENEAMLHRLHHKHLLEAMQELYQFVCDNEPTPAQSAIEQLQILAEWYQSHVLHSDSKLMVTHSA